MAREEGKVTLEEWGRKWEERKVYEGCSSTLTWGKAALN